MGSPSLLAVFVVAGFGLLFCVAAAASMAQRRGRWVLGSLFGTFLLFPAMLGIGVVLSFPLLLAAAFTPARGAGDFLWLMVFILTALSTGMTCLLMRSFLGPLPVAVQEEEARRAAAAARPLVPSRQEVVGTFLADMILGTIDGARWLGQRLRRIRRRH